MASHPSDSRDVLARRVNFVEALSAAPKHKTDLVAELDCSRSTVNRAVTELESAGYVERVNGGYAATHAGRLAAREYRAHVARQASILAARDVLSDLPRDWTVPAELLVGAHVETAAPADRLLDLLGDEFASADLVRFVGPAVLDARSLELCHSRVIASDLSAVFQARSDALVDAARASPGTWADLAATDGFETRRGTDPPVGLVVVAGDDEGSVALVAADDAGVAGFVHTRHPAAVEWARDRADGLAADEVATD